MRPLAAISILLALTSAAIPAPAPAQMTADVVAARGAGLVGERYDGYLGFAARPPDDVRRHVGAVNITRKSLYTSLAARRGAMRQEVEIAAGCELLATVGVGEHYMLNDGKWRVRSAGEAAPVPDYCSR